MAESGGNRRGDEYAGFHNIESLGAELQEAFQFDGCQGLWNFRQLSSAFHPIVAAGKQ